MSGGKKKRSALDAGQQQANAATQQGVNALNPYAQAGIPATNQLSNLAGLNTPQAQAQSRAQFEASPFYTAGQNAFGLEKDAVDAGLSNQGLLFSSARLGAVEDARQRNYSNAFQNYLNTTSGLAGMGLQGAGGQANLYGQQGQNALNTGIQKANTYQGVLGTLGQISQIGANFGAAASGFSDRRLKTAVTPIGKRGPLTLYKWRWNDDAKALGLDGPSSGFMAEEVAKVMPEAVGMRQGYQTVDYGAVLERFA